MYQSSYWGQDLDKRLVDNHIIGVESASLDRKVDTLHVDDLDSKRIISIFYYFDHTGIFVVLASWMMSQCRILLKLCFHAIGIIFKVCKIRFHLYSNIKGACIPKLKAKATETWTVLIHPKIIWCGTKFDFICKLIWNHNFPTDKFNPQTLNTIKNRTAVNLWLCLFLACSRFYAEPTAWRHKRPFDNQNYGLAKQFHTRHMV